MISFLSNFLHFIQNPFFPAAVPSKRDMQALIKVIQSELTMAAAEGDTQGGWLRAVSREAVKSIQLVRSSQTRSSFTLSSSDVEMHLSIMF